MDNLAVCVAWLNTSCIFLTHFSLHSNKRDDSVPFTRQINQGAVRWGVAISRTKVLDLFDFSISVPFNTLGSQGPCRTREAVSKEGALPPSPR